MSTHCKQCLLAFAPGQHARGRPSRAKRWVISLGAPALPGEPQTSPHPWVLDPAHAAGQAAPSLPSSREGSPGTPAPALMSSRALRVSSPLHACPPRALTSPRARTSLPASQGLGDSPCHPSWPSCFPSPTVFCAPPPPSSLGRKQAPRGQLLLLVIKSLPSCLAASKAGTLEGASQLSLATLLRTDRHR